MIKMSIALMEIANYIKSNQANSSQVGRSTPANPILHPQIQNKELLHASNTSSK